MEPHDVLAGDVVVEDLGPLHHVGAAASRCHNVLLADHQALKLPGARQIGCRVAVDPVVAEIVRLFGLAIPVPVRENQSRMSEYLKAWENMEIRL